METQLPRITFYEDETFSLVYQAEGGVANVHFYVKSYTHNTVKKWYRETERMKIYLRESGIKTIITISPNPRCVEMFNGIHLGSLNHEDKNYEVFKWDLT